MFQAFDPESGEMRCLHLLPFSQSMHNHLRVVSDLASAYTNLPTILDRHRRQNDVAVRSQSSGS
jgi:hypothetical protein